jgi:hypothetical protein
MTKNTRFVLSVAAVGLMAVVFAPYALADTVNIPLTDPSFEDNPVAYGATSTNGIVVNEEDQTQNTFWTQAFQADPDHGDVIWNPTTASFLKDGSGNLLAPASGSQCLYVTGDYTNTVALYQYVPLSGGIQPDATYTCTVAFGLPAGVGGAGYAISLNDDDADTLAYVNPDTSGRIPADQKFHDVSATFTGAWVLANCPNGIGENLYLAVVGDGGMCIDNVRLTMTTVPEPSTLVLLTAGLLSLLAYARRRGGK